jgi:hypothetical protein
MQPSTTTMSPTPAVEPPDLGDTVLYHFNSRIGLTTRAAFVTGLVRGSYVNLTVLLDGPDTDVSIDLAETGGLWRECVRGSLDPMPNTWTRR